MFAGISLAALEGGLRWAGYGYSTHFFREIQIGGERMLVENDKFGLRFFPPEMARSPAPVAINAVKPAGTYRIFILGESAALGDPRPAFGAGRYLEKLLTARYPSMRFEVVCVAMTAINSHAILPIARECARHEGDCWIVYMGNNEMVGPFGAASVFGSRAPSMTYARLIIAVQRWRAGQLLMAAARRIAGRSSDRLQWEGMAMFQKNQIAPNDPRKEAVYRNFERNLRDILDAGRKAGAQVLLNTVAVNVRDCAPFASLPRLRDPSKPMSHGGLTNPTSLADLNAEAEFQLGTALLREGKAASALPHLLRARDLDALPFRADSRINEIIAAAANRHRDFKLHFYDAAREFAEAAPDHAPGDEVFFEHVHFNFDGNYRLGRAWAEQIGALLPQATAAAGDSPAWLDQEACERKLGLTDWNREAVHTDVLRRLAVAPFVQQSNHAERTERLRGKIAEIRNRQKASGVEAAQAVYAEALQGAPNDHRLPENYAEFLEATGSLSLALKEWERVRDLLPHHHVAYYQCGRVQMRLGHLVEAEQQLTKAVTLRPDLAEGWLDLGQLEAARGNNELALTYYDRERLLAPGDARVYYHRGRACSKLGRRTEAMTNLQEALRLRPTYWEAHYLLGEELAFGGQTDLARRQFENVLRLKPDYAMAHFNLGVALVQAGERAAGIEHLREAYRLDPNNRQAAEYVAKLDRSQK